MICACCNVSITKTEWNWEKERTALNLAHFKKIEVSDAVYVVNLQGYIGEQTKKEIAFAESLGREIIFHTEFKGDFS